MSTGDDDKDPSSCGFRVLPAISTAGDPCAGERRSDLEPLLDALFLFLGTSCSLNDSLWLEDAAGLAICVCDRSFPTTGDTLDEGGGTGSLRFRMESINVSEGVRPFS
jgi:hypothetical protein